MDNTLIEAFVCFIILILIIGIVGLISFLSYKLIYLYKDYKYLDTHYSVAIIPYKDFITYYHLNKNDYDTWVYHPCKEIKNEFKHTVDKIVIQFPFFYQYLQWRYFVYKNDRKKKQQKELEERQKALYLYLNSVQSDIDAIKKENNKSQKH